MRAATRERVWSAAVRVFARQGYAATNMRRIAAEAGISTGLIYRHAATKEELFADLVTRAAEGLGTVAERFRDARRPGETLRAFTEEFVGDLSGDGEYAEFHRLVHQAFAQGLQEGDGASAAVRTLVERRDELLRATVELIRCGQRSGGFRAGDPRELADCYFAMLDGLVTMRFGLGEGFCVPGVDTLTGFLAEGEHDG
ncbi:TetR/AcrR family transcriptional regulator [Nocardiopsis gilva YIM 90087]|uniref:TetR/AcrR family transcriptional regulator n=2 Tax=Nocardiopsis gilva TaxID=280236 RepID=A0A223SAJ1_9ACTN|nr:TetR/AcrR family transcriptional regulator [Nocardiopsis gilva YIM 90087]